MPVVRTMPFGVLLALAFTGCAITPDPDLADAAPVELDSVPFVAQTTDQCGPASLSMVLRHAGANVSLEELRGRVYLPARNGALQAEMLAAVRFSNRVAHRIAPTTDALLQNLHDGRPVLVLQDLGIAWRQKWHYAVLIGYLPSQDAFVLRSGPERRLLVTRRRFEKSWEAGGRWGIVALNPGEIPTAAVEADYLRDLAAFESAGHRNAALKSYSAALARWPHSTVARLAFANAHYARADLEKAVPIYESIVRDDPLYLPALNNLAIVYNDLGKTEAALETIEQAIQQARDSGLLPTLLATRDELRNPSSSM